MSLGPVGMNTGMDINSMVSGIVNAERAPKQNRIDSQRMENQASISAYGRLRESLDTMKDLMANFRQEEAFAKRKVSSTAENSVSATATTDAIAGQYSIDVLQLAQSHKVASGVFNEDVRFGAGKLQISSGDDSFTVNVSNHSRLRDIVNGINYARNNPGVRASVINDKDGPRLIVAANNTGKEHQIQISVESEAGNPLKRLEYKTLEQRIKDIENARSEAQQLINPLTPEEQELAAGVAEKLESAARVVDESVADEIHRATSGEDNRDISTDSLESSQVNSASNAAEGLNQSIKPEDRIPGWSETASGTLLDSYQEPENELDAAAKMKSQDVPGWSNTASGTLYDSYLTPQEAEKALNERLEETQKTIDAAVERGDMSFEQAKQAAREQMTPEEQAYLDRVASVKDQLDRAQSSYSDYQGMVQVQAGQDSEVLMDGVARLSSSNNIIEDAIEGVDISLSGVTKEKPAEIGIDYDRDSVRKDIESFVNAYNQFYALSKQLSGVDPTTGEAGPLSGDSVVRTADSRLKRVFSTAIDTAPENLKTLTEFGITTTRQGTLEINNDMLSRQLNNNFDKLGAFFGGRDGFAKHVEDAIQGLTGVSGSIRTRENSAVERNYQLDDDQASLNRRMDALEDRTKARFQAMQDATGNMQSQLSGMMNVLGQ